METSPVIDKKVIILFKETFDNKDISESKRKMFEQLKKPEICDSLESVQLSIYKEDDTKKKENKFKNLINEVIININDTNNDSNLNMKFTIIREFIDNFKTDMLRNPTVHEIKNNLENSEIGITEQLINDYLEEYPLHNEIVSNQSNTQLNNLELDSL